jgi:hypothetical protein
MSTSRRPLLSHFLSYARAPQPPPAEPPRERFLYGMAQPLLGIRIVLRDRELLAEAFRPAILLAGFCALTAWLGIGEGKSWLGRFYTTFALLAPLPSVIFAAHYARMAAQTRRKLGFGPCEPKREALPTVIWRAAAQAIVVAAGLLPVLALIKLFPFVGRPLAQALAGLWALQWVVVDAFDDARVRKPGVTQRMLDREAELAPRPWFVRFFHSLGKALPAPLSSLCNGFGNLVDRLSKSFREEVALIEAHPALAAGFALATAALLATPVLNLFFRPIILVGSAHLLGHLEKTEQAVEAPPLPAAPSLKLPLG